MELTLRNTADHFLVPGDSAQLVEVDGTGYRVVSVEASSVERILTYGLQLIPARVKVTLELDVPVVVQ